MINYKGVTDVEITVIVSIIVIVAVIISVAAVSLHQEKIGRTVHSGTVIDKTYHAQWIQQVGEGTFTTHPEKWLITIEGMSDETGNLQQRLIQVSEAQYFIINLGDRWSEEGGFEEDDG